MLEPGSWSSAAAGARLLAMNALVVPAGTTTEAADARPASDAAAGEAAAGAAVWACAPCAAFISRAAANWRPTSAMASAVDWEDMARKLKEAAAYLWCSFRGSEPVAGELEPKWLRITAY